MKTLLTAILLVILQSLCFISFGQSAADAYAKYESKDYKGSGQAYDLLLKAGKSGATDYYNAACSWALAGDKNKAFTYLSQSVNKGWEAVDHLKQDFDLSSLHADKRWPMLVQDLEKRMAVKEAKYDKPLKAQLENIFDTDQRYRYMIDSVEKKHGMESAQMKELWTRIEAQDQENKEQVIDILGKRGWPGVSLVGSKASSAVFLVIQHSDKETMEKYIPMLRETVAKGEASKSSLALMEDRVRMNQSLPQLYGSQLQMNPATKKYELYKVEDEANLDKRRAEMGLGPISDYLKLFNK